jgi:MFS family permease
VAADRSGPLSLPAFRLLAFGQLTSTLGDYCYAVALPWLVLSGGGSAASLGVVLACYGIPRAVLIMPAGALADRVGPRRVMLCADYVRCGLTVAFALLAASHQSAPVVLGPVAALLGACSALFMPASMSMMPSLVDGERLTSANSVYTTIVQVGSVLGPALGGALVAVAGPAPAFAVDAGSYLASAVTLTLISRAGGRPAPALETTTGAAPAEAAGEAEAPSPGSVWALLRQSPFLRILLVVVVASNLAVFGTTEVALPALAHARYGAGGYGAVLAVVAVTTIIGVLAVARIGRRMRPVTLLASAFLLAAAAIGAAPFLGGLPGLAAGLAVFGFAMGFDQVVSVTLIQRWAPPALLGRVWGLLLLAGAGGFPVATLLAGLLARHLGPTAVFPAAGALLALGMLFGLAHPHFRAFGAGPA